MIHSSALDYYDELCAVDEDSEENRSTRAGLPSDYRTSPTFRQLDLSPSVLRVRHSNHYRHLDFVCSLTGTHASCSAGQY